MFYFISYYSDIFQNAVIADNPIDWQIANPYKFILFFKEITEDEYNRFKEKQP